MNCKIFFLVLTVVGTILAENNQMNSVYGVVLAGGSGERLWPLSRKDKPKQFLCLGSEKTLLEQAISRLRIVPQIDSVYVTSGRNYALQVKQLCGDTIDSVIVEPVARNTGPAILYACLQVYKKDPNAILIFVPSDAFIPESDSALFRAYIQRMIQTITMDDCIALFGVQPTYPATGYGYIEYDIDKSISSFYTVSRFHEKPSRECALDYSKQENMLWNISVFGARASFFIQEFKQHAPDMFHAMNEYMSGDGLYEDIPAVSVDCAVIEKSSTARVLPVDFSWCDVGNLEMFLSIKYPRHNSANNILNINASNSLVDVPDKLVALIGVDDLCVVETNDTLLIAKRSDVEKVREVVAQLKRTKQVEYL